METVLYCECGFEARGGDEEVLVAEIRRHARDAHGMALSHDDALLLAFRAELEANPSTATPPKTAHKRREE